MTQATQTIPAGYKQTEIGVIPADWDVKKLGDIGETIIGLTYSPNDVVDYGVLVHRSSNIQGNRLAYEDNVYVNKQVNEKLVLKNGDVLICVRNGSRDLIGKSALIKGKSVGETFGAFMSVYRTSGNQQFIFYLILSNLVQKQINQSLGATINQITNKTLNNFQIPFPTAPIEQTAIATILSDTDALIEKLEKLIAKKKAIKQGAMQQLLTGKKRLLGFSEKWYVKKLKDITTYRRGSFPQPYGLEKWYDNNLGMPFVQVFDVDENFKLKNETKQRISKEGARFSVFVKKGTIVLTIQGSIGRICITQYDSYVDRTLLIFESFKEQFDKYFFMLKVFQKFEIEKQKAPGGIIKTITKGALSEFEIEYPSNLQEQIAIATILSNMDTEIEKLENKLNKYYQIKTGMMQQLLTGKIRLIKE